jgi:hypothetical protein
MSMDASTNQLRRERPLAESPLLSPEERAIFRNLDDGFSEVDWQRYEELLDRLEAETLPAAERDELVTFTERREAYAVRRLEKLVELARLRGKTLDEVVDQLGLRYTPITG